MMTDHHHVNDFEGSMPSSPRSSNRINAGWEDYENLPPLSHTVSLRTSPVQSRTTRTILSNMLNRESPEWKASARAASIRVSQEEVYALVTDGLAFRQLQNTLRASGGMTDATLKLNLHSILWQVREDMEWRRLNGQKSRVAASVQSPNSGHNRENNVNFSSTVMRVDSM